MTAARILDLLAAKHRNDVFVAECKNGATHAADRGELQRLDAWVMPRSWAHPATTGYEIKISRQDFLHDEKWRGYMKLCNCFYFVCPKGIIQPDELPPEVGLMWATPNRVITHRKAVLRRIDEPLDLWRYVLMCRTRIVGDHLVSKSEMWRRWLAEKAENQKLGHEVRGRIRKIYQEIEDENARLMQQNQHYDDLRATLIALGFNPEHPPVWNRERALKQAISGIPRGLANNLRETARAAIAAAESLEKVRT